MSNPTRPTGAPTPEEILGQAFGPEFGYYYDSLREVEAPLVVKLGGGVLTGRTIEQTCGTLSVINALDVPMVLVHGGGVQIDNALNEQGKKYEKVDGYRITDTDILGTAITELNNIRGRLTRTLTRRGVKAVSFDEDTLEAELKDGGELGLVGEVIGMDTHRITGALDLGHVPVISCLGVAPGSKQRLNINADNAGSAIAVELGAHKYAGITKGGGLIDANDRVVPVVTITNGQSNLVDGFIRDGVIWGGMLPKIESAMRAVNELPVESSVVLTRPTSLLRELFTHQGEGTLIRQGDAINRIDSFEGVNTEQLRGIIEGAFGHSRTLRADYFDSLPHNATGYVTAQQYNGVAIVFPGKQEEDPAYLDKIAVSPAAQGAGVGRELLDKAASEHPHGLFWRTKASSTDNVEWYSRFADRQATVGEWVVFGMNVPEEKFNDCVQQAVAHASTI